MRDYVDRLIRCGFPPHTAYDMCYSMIKEFGEAELEIYIKILECSAYGAPYVD